MCKNNSLRLLSALWLWPLILLAAATENEFAWQWPLQLAEPDAGVYQVTLDASVYQAAYWPDWRDIQVVDADNQPVPAAVYLASKPPPQTSSQLVELSWFVLPTRAQSATDLNSMLKRDGDGRVITINDSSTSAQTISSPAWLIDSGNHSGQLRALIVEWSDPEAVLDVGYRLEASDDLRQWQVLVSEVRLLQLHNDEKQLRNNRIAFNTQQRYLRLVPLRGNGAVPALQRLRAEIVQKTVAQATWHWLELSAQADHQPGGFEYRLSGRFPIQRLDVIMPANSTATWQVFSLEEEKSSQPNERGVSWIMRSRQWDTWWINGKNATMPVQISAPLDLGQTLTSQQWRLKPVSLAALPQAPTLRLGWQPGSVLFLAQGRAPYTLVAGSANIQTKSNQPALEPILAALRQHNDPHWQPSPASLGKAVLRAGDKAYYIAPELPDREKILLKLLLWGVLISGVLIVGQFAINLLRRLPAAETAKKDES